MKANKTKQLPKVLMPPGETPVTIPLDVILSELTPSEKPAVEVAEIT